MALYWDWKSKVGEFVFENFEGKRHTEELYQGNALLIAVYTYKENDKDMYMVTNFFVDEEHAKRCLGLAKGWNENIFNNGRQKLVKIRLNKSKHTKAQKLLGMFIKAFDELEIELYKD